MTGAKFFYRAAADLHDACTIDIETAKKNCFTHASTHVVRFKTSRGVWWALYGSITVQCWLQDARLQTPRHEDVVSERAFKTS